MNEERGISFGLPLRVAIRSDVGNVRTNNEDSAGHVWLDDGALFVIVADGMGGHEAGEVASGLAVDVLGDFVGRDPGEDPRERLYRGMMAANEAILEEGRSIGQQGMGTTAVAAILKGREAFVGLVGDSRLYHIRRGQLVWRTLDHTRVQSLIDRGMIDEEDAKEHPEAGMLTRALGHSRMANGGELVPDVFAEPLELEPQDALLMCSDGLHDLVEDWEIGTLVAGLEPEAAAASLVELACDRGGHDNVTVAVITVGERAADYDPDYIPPVLEPEESLPDHATSDETVTIPASDAVLQAEVELEQTRERPLDLRLPVVDTGARPQGLLFGLAAVSLVAMVGVAVGLLAIAVAAVWFFAGG